MASKRSIAKKSERSATKRSRPLRVSPVRTTDPPRVSLPDAVSSLRDRLQTERDRIFKALSIVECCRFATATKFEVSDSEYMVPAFEAISDLLNTSAEELEQVASECE
jgi:hypothetical protein